MEALVMGAVIGAVSPAVVVPRMVQLMEKKYGTGKSIPQMILAGASCDDIFVIVLFTTFVGMAQGGTAEVRDFLNIPISIVLGVLFGVVVGWILSLFLETAYACQHYVRNSTKVIIVLGVSFVLVAIETWLEGIVSVSGVLAVVAMACMLKIKCAPSVTKRLAEKFGKLWIAAVFMIFLALAIRAVGVVVCMLGTRLNWKERLFCVIAYLPKATVQAAIGSVPLSLGLPCGKIILSVAVLAILITAPLGVIGMDAAYKKFLVRDDA